MKIKLLKHNKLIILAVFLAVLLMPGCSNSIDPNVDSITEKDNEKQEIANNKIKELESLVAKQQQDIEKQNETIRQLEEKINDSVANVEENVEKNKDCSADVNKYCVSDSFMDADKFEKFLDHYKESFDDAAYQKYKKQFTEQFNNCQKALRCN